MVAQGIETSSTNADISWEHGQAPPVPDRVEKEWNVRAVCYLMAKKQLAMAWPTCDPPTKGSLPTTTYYGLSGTWLATPPLRSLLQIQQAATPSESWAQILFWLCSQRSTIQLWPFLEEGLQLACLTLSGCVTNRHGSDASLFAEPTMHVALHINPVSAPIPQCS